MTTTPKGSKPGLEQHHDAGRTLPPLAEGNSPSFDASEQTLTEKEDSPRGLEHDKWETFPQGANGICPTSSHPQTGDDALDDEVTYPEGGLKAWLVVLGSFSAMLAAFGMMNTSKPLTSYPSYYLTLSADITQ